MGLGWALGANSCPREAACLGRSPTGCRHQSEHSDPGPEARGHSSKNKGVGSGEDIELPRAETQSWGDHTHPNTGSRRTGEEGRTQKPGDRKSSLKYPVQQQTLTQMTPCAAVPIYERPEQRKNEEAGQCSSEHTGFCKPPDLCPLLAEWP